MSLFVNKKENYKDKKSLVIYFSRADENYAVGYIEKGNTEVIAEFIRDIIGADLFKIEGAQGIYWGTCVLGNYASGNDNFIRKIGFYWKNS